MHLPIFSQLSLVQIVEAIIGVASLAGLIILANVLQQLYKRPNEPPVVFHYVPIIGSAIAYGMNPFNFFFECQKKVCSLKPPTPALKVIDWPIPIDVSSHYSTEMYSPSFSSVEKSPSISVPKEIGSSCTARQKTSTPRRSTPA